MVPKRFRGLEERRLEGGLRVFVARSYRARLLGLALLADLDPCQALLIPRCRSVHTFGMRFPIDVAFLDATGHKLRLARALRPGRVVAHRGAAAVLERRATSHRGAAPTEVSVGAQEAPTSEASR